MFTGYTMTKFKPEDLDKITEKMKVKDYKIRIIVHTGTCGIAAGAEKIMKTLTAEIENQNLKEINIIASSCAGLCSVEPMVTVEVEGKIPVKYAKLDPEKAKEILDKHVVGGEIVKDYVFGVGSERML